MIVRVRFHGTGLALDLPADRRPFTIGTSASCDLVVPQELAGGARDVHATIERTDDDAIRVTARRPGFVLAVVSDPRCGLLRSAHSPPVYELLLYAGAVGWIGRVPVVAMDRRLEALRPRLAWSLGLDAHAAVDDAITAVADPGPLLLIGPRGTDVLPLARAIHDATPEAVEFVERSRPTRDDEDATLCVNLDAVRTLTAPQAAELFSPWRTRRVILRATTRRRARDLLDSYIERVRTLELPPLASRPSEIARLLGTIWRDDLGTFTRVEELGPGALDAITAYPWPGNFDELRAHAVRLLAYHECGSLRSAARALGIKHQTLAGHLNRIGVPILDLAERELMSDLRTRENAR